MQRLELPEVDGVSLLAEVGCIIVACTLDPPLVILQVVAMVLVIGLNTNLRLFMHIDCLELRIIIIN